MTIGIAGTPMDDKVVLRHMALTHAAKFASTPAELLSVAAQIEQFLADAPSEQTQGPFLGRLPGEKTIDAVVRITRAGVSRSAIAEALGIQQHRVSLLRRQGSVAQSRSISATRLTVLRQQAAYMRARKAAS